MKLEDITIDHLEIILKQATLDTITDLKSKGFGRKGIHAIADIILHLPEDGFHGDLDKKAKFDDAIAHWAESIFEEIKEKLALEQENNLEEAD